ncbi:phage tail protein, partial [Citrobacter koseri]|nr:phage tail protein [Citrobacter koseri]
MTDTFNWRTRKTAQGTENVRTLQAQFGDGYKQ